MNVIIRKKKLLNIHGRDNGMHPMKHALLTIKKTYIKKVAEEAHNRPI